MNPLLQTEQLKLVQKHMPLILIFSLVSSSFLVLALYEVVTKTYLFGWLGTIYALTLIRGFYYFHVGKNGVDGNVKRNMIAFSFLSGCAWGIAGVLFFLPDQPISLALVALLLGGMTAGSVASTSAYPPIYFAYAIPTMLPGAITALLHGGSNFVIFGILLLMFLAINLGYSINIYKTILESLKLRFENIDLIDKLTLQKEIAENASTAKSKFMAAASHDLRQPLHAQGLFLDRLQTEITTNKGSEMFAQVLHSKRTLDQMFSGILDISKLDAGVIKAKHDVFAIAPLVDAISSEFTNQIEERQLTLNINVAPTNVTSDRVLVSRVLRNFISNAVRYTGRGSINIAGKQRGDVIELSVADTGPGIPQSELRNIFSEYHQLNNPERDRNKGLGLGLAIVDRLSELLDIKISVESELGTGTVFKFALPISSEVVSKETNSNNTLKEIKGLTVMVIDDETEILDGMRQVLDTWNCNGIIARTADKAISISLNNNQKPDIIIADYRLQGGVLGTDAARQVLEEYNADIPVIIISGDTEVGRISDVIANGFRLMHKPVPPKELKLAIQQELTNNRV